MNLTFIHSNGTEILSKFDTHDFLNGINNLKINGITSEGFYMLNISNPSPIEYIILVNQDSNVRLIQPNTKVFEVDYENE